MAGITAKQVMFANEFIKTGNAEASAKKAGYNARGNTTKLLHNTTIATYIKDKNKKLEKSTIADMEEIKQFWSDMVRDKEIKPTDRLKASELIGKTNGAFIDKVESTTIDLTKTMTNEQRKTRLAELMNKR